MISTAYKLYMGFVIGVVIIGNDYSKKSGPCPYGA